MNPWLVSANCLHSNSQNERALPIDSFVIRCLNEQNSKAERERKQNEFTRL